MTHSSDHSLEGLAIALALDDGPADEAGTWPERLWSSLGDAGATRWALPPEWGGPALDRAELLAHYAGVAEGSLTAAFILTQHDASIRRLVASGPTPMARQWLDKIANQKTFTTVGISQLTTSRRHGTHAVKATYDQKSNGYRIDGVVPWVTAAEKAKVIVIGAVVEETNDQLLIALPTDRLGVRIAAAFELAALQASRTAEVVCEGVRILPEEVLAGPAADVMSGAGKPGSTGGLETSALALGQAKAALRALEAEASKRDDLAGPVAALASTWSSLWSDLSAAAREDPSAPPAAFIRGEANSLVTRATQAYLTARKGSGFLKSDPAQRWARQALFFLVWSCPGPVATAAIHQFAGVCSDV